MLRTRAVQGSEADSRKTSYDRFKTWLDHAQPRRQDVLGDFAGRELCVIHGESLLVYCLAEARVDFQGGLQLLHLVHAVETFLEKLRSRRCNFHIVWFDDHEHLLLPASFDGDGDEKIEAGPEDYYAWHTAFHKRRLARVVLIRHLQLYCQHASPAVQLNYQFPSLSSAEFVEYTKQHPVRLFFVSDGQAASICDSMTTSHALASETVPHREASVMTFNGIIFGLSLSGYTVGLLDDIEFKSSEIQAGLYSAQSGLSTVAPSWELAPPLQENLGTDETLLESLMDLDAVKNKALTSRERTAVVSLASILAKDESQETKRRVEAFIMHLAIIKHCPMSQRPTTTVYSCRDLEAAKLDTHFINLFCSAATAILARQQGGSAHFAKDWDTYDLVDGRIWASVLQASPELDSKGPVLRSLKTFSSLIFDVTGVSLWTGSEGLKIQSGPHRTDTTSKPLQPSLLAHESQSLLAFSQPDFDNLLRDVVVEAFPARMEPHSTFGSKLFKEDTHWHSDQKLVALPSRASVQDSHYAEMKRHRRKQQQVMRIHNYAASLTNAVGKVLESETIILTNPDGPGNDSKTTKAKRSVPQKAKPGNKESQRALLIQQRETRLQNSERDGAIAGWRAAFARFQKVPDAPKRYNLVSDFLQSRSSIWMQTVGPDAILYACCILGRQLSTNNDQLRAIAPELKALVWRHLQDLRKLPLSNDISEAAKLLSLSFGFSMDFVLYSNEPGQCFLSKDIVMPTLAGFKRDKSLRQSNETKMLLETCGPYMEKGFDSQPDTRVSNFNPDAWQRNVLDVIDKRQSLFVVAPTSAGKTFISFYAMKQVLMESHDGVLVYVAPTKALCNQVAADIQARFSKAYPPMMVGKSIWAIHTRDYRINTSTNCQILVTVPQMLQILLLAPSTSAGNVKNPWTSRIKWIIFDEVHSIGLSEDGIVWEQLLLMAPCPIIALSATVGNPYEFKSWVEDCEHKKGRELQMIIHSARYSDLRCYFWKPKDDFTFAGAVPANRWPVPGLGPDGYNQDSPFTAIHPVSALLDRSRDTLDDISIESRDCLTLWTSMNRHQSDKYRLDPALDPRTFFSGSAIVKAKVVAWETELKRVLLVWLRNHDSPFSKVQRDLTTLEQDAPSRRYGVHQTLQLLVDLQKRDALPALVFLYDRNGCKMSVLEIVEQLRKYEKQWKETSPEWARTLAAFERYKKNVRHSHKKATKVSKGSKRGKQDDDDGDDDGGPSSKLDAVRDAASQEASMWDSFDPDAPLDRFSFANHKKLQKSELEKYIKDLDSVHLDNYIVEGLRRGVAVHHAGMNRGYLQVVEILFRKGFLSAVVATGTLALGINMPCKTVVFAGDSTFLTALNYRQGAGRAGRRGFDILGNVVFYDFTPQRAMEVMSLRLSDLRGHFPISTSLILRVATLLNQTNRCTFAQQCLEALFSQTRIYQGGPEGKGAIKHHLRFSIEYLRHHHLLSADGAPINFSGLVSHLHYSENSVFALHSLLESGYLHRLCADIHRNEDAVLDTLMLVLCHLFGRIPCRRYKDAEWLRTKVHRSSSKVLLPRLPADAEKTLHDHNASTLSVFRSYVQTYIHQYLGDQPDDTLPFTGHKVAPEVPSTEYFHTSRLPVELRSPFTALSGFTDDFQSVRELCSTVRAGVFLEESSVPYLAIYPVDTDGMPFNAYIYDFFRHGELSTIINANGIKNSDAWYLLQDFSLVLKTILASIAKFISPSDALADDDFELDGLSSDDDEFESDNNDGSGGLRTPLARVVDGNAVSQKPKTIKRKKAKVVDSWEDATSESKTNDGGGTNKKDENGVGRHGSASAAVPGAAFSAQSSPEQGFAAVYLAFGKLQEQFDQKFHKVWA